MYRSVLLITAIISFGFSQKIQFVSPEGVVIVEASHLPTNDFTDYTSFSNFIDLRFDITFKDSVDGKLYMMPIFATDLSKYVLENQKKFSSGTRGSRNVKLFKKIMRDFKVTLIPHRNLVTKDELLKNKEGSK